MHLPEHRADVELQVLARSRVECPGKAEGSMQVGPIDRLFLRVCQRRIERVRFLLDLCVVLRPQHKAVESPAEAADEGDLFVGAAARFGFGTILQHQDVIGRHTWCGQEDEV